jgi:hypothetical protein
MADELDMISVVAMKLAQDVCAGSRVASAAGGDFVQVANVYLILCSKREDQYINPAH